RCSSPAPAINWRHSSPPWARPRCWKWCARASPASHAARKSSASESGPSVRPYKAAPNTGRLFYRRGTQRLFMLESTLLLTLARCKAVGFDSGGSEAGEGEVHGTDNPVTQVG